MKIGVFGDSFGHDHLGKLQHRNDFCWPRELANKFDVTNYCLSGTSLYYSYNLLLENMSKFDKVIFLAGQNNRMEFFSDTNRESISNNSLFHLSPGVIPKNEDMYYNYKEYFEKRTPHNWNELHSNITFYYKHFFNPKQSIHYTRLMLADIALHQNILTIPLFPPTYINYLDDEKPYNFAKYKYDTCLCEVSYKENTFWNVNRLKNNYKDTRHCHLSDDNNKIVFDKIVEWLNTGKFKLMLKDFVFNTKDKEKYYIKQSK